MKRVGNLLDVSDMFLGEREILKERPDSVEGRRMGKYEKIMREGGYLTITFTKADAEGNLSVVDGDVTLVMQSDQINGRPYDLKYKAQKLAEAYCVKVVGVEGDSKRVFVSQHTARMEKQPEIIGEIDRRLNLKRKSPIRVKGRVVKIQTKKTNEGLEDTGVWLDLCGVGVLGYVHISKWKPTYTPELRGEVRYGDVVEVVVQEKKTRNGNAFHYICSRKELLEDPWDSKELNEKYHVGDIVRIRCLSMHPNHWFGEINGLKDIQVFTEYPSTARDFSIIPGMEYLGKIYHMDTKERSLKARVFQSLTLNRLQDENVKNQNDEQED